MAADLSISPEKAKQLRNVFIANNNKLRSVLSNNKLQPKERVELLKKLEQERNDALNSVMTPEQKAAYLKHQPAPEKQLAAAQEILDQRRSTLKTAPPKGQGKQNTEAVKENKKN
jgi:Mg/Co/Ni transporter MgtE